LQMRCVIKHQVNNQQELNTCFLYNWDTQLGNASPFSRFLSCSHVREVRSSSSPCSFSGFSPCMAADTLLAPSPS
jgi:hypothetical protein